MKVHHQTYQAFFLFFFWFTFIFVSAGDQTWGSMAKAAAGRLKSYASGTLNESRLLSLWKKTATQLWVEGVISNFQYLMVISITSYVSNHGTQYFDAASKYAGRKILQ